MRKKLWTLLLTLAMLTVCLVTAQAADSPVRAEASGSSGAITVTVYAGADARSGSFTLHYSDELTLAEAVSGLAHSSVNAGQGSVAFAWTDAESGAALLRLRFQGGEKESYPFLLRDLKVFDGSYQAVDCAAEVSFQWEKPAAPIPGGNSGGSGNGGSTEEHQCPSEKFQDVDTDLWYHEAIDYVVENGIMNGVSADRFAPDRTTTRGMLVKMLGTLAGIRPADYAKTVFTDVAGDSWCGPYAAWAAEKGVVLGYADGSFRPNDTLTREQLVTMLYRYWKSLGNQWQGDAGALNAFADRGSVGTYALEAMQWAVSQGVIHGKTAQVLAPKDGCTRAQVAQILWNYQNMG